MRMLERFIAGGERQDDESCIFESPPVILALWQSPGVTDASPPDPISDSHPFYYHFPNFRRRRLSEIKRSSQRNPSDSKACRFAKSIRSAAPFSDPLFPCHTLIPLYLTIHY